MSKVNPAKFMREVRQEIDKITWPTRKETIISTVMVLVLVIVASIFFVGVDAAIALMIRLILGLGG